MSYDDSEKLNLSRCEYCIHSIGNDAMIGLYCIELDEMVTEDDLCEHFEENKQC